MANQEWEKAREACKSLLEARNNSGYGPNGIARGCELEGNTAEARTADENFLEAWASADKDRPRVQHAQDLLAANGR
ncbi:MAG: hypothetical protein P8Y01_01055 [Woeseiaceae bacterium]|jgi:hypothetical protein